jgi:microcystin-dependent protein
MFAGAAAPVGWLLCDGTSYLRASYPGLFAALGGVDSPWGLADGTHFNVPDMRGIFPKGAGTVDGTNLAYRTGDQTGKDANAAYYAGVRGTYSQDRVQGHKHNNDPPSTSVGVNNNSAQHKHSISCYVASTSTGSGGLVSGSTSSSDQTFPDYYDGASQGYESLTHTHTYSHAAFDSAVPKTDGSNGTPRTGVLTEPQSVGINFIISTGVHNEP